MCQHHGAFAPGARAASVANALLGSRPSGQWAATRPGRGSGAEGLAVGRSLAPEGPGLCSSARPARKGRHVASVPGRATQRPPAPPESEHTPQPLDLCRVARASRLRDGRSRARPGRGVVASRRRDVVASGRRGVMVLRHRGIVARPGRGVGASGRRDVGASWHRGARAGPASWPLAARLRGHRPVTSAALAGLATRRPHLHQGTWPSRLDFALHRARRMSVVLRHSAFQGGGRCLRAAGHLCQE